jgi:hypothetical protein
MAATDMTVTIRAKDEVTPVLRRISRQLWWARHGTAVLFALWTVIAFVLGEIAGRL